MRILIDTKFSDNFRINNMLFSRLTTEFDNDIIATEHIELCSQNGTSNDIYMTGGSCMASGRDRTSGLDL